MFPHHIRKVKYNFLQDVDFVKKIILDGLRFAGKIKHPHEGRFYISGQVVENHRKKAC